MLFHVSFMLDSAKWTDFKSNSKQSGCWWAKSIIKGCSKYPESCIFPDFGHPNWYRTSFINPNASIIIADSLRITGFVPCPPFSWSNAAPLCVTSGPCRASLRLCSHAHWDIYGVRYVYTECNNPKTHMLDVRWIQHLPKEGFAFFPFSFLKGTRKFF